MIQQARSAGDLELFGKRGQALAAGLGDEYRVLDAHAGEPLDVDARLDGADHARGEHVAAGPAQPGGLVHFAAHPVAGAVAELLAGAPARRMTSISAASLTARRRLKRLLTSRRRPRCRRRSRRYSS